MNDNLYKNQELKLINKSVLSLTGIKKIINLEKDEVSLDSVYGKILIKGSNIEVMMVDVDKGELKIKGNIDSFTYIENKKLNKESLFNKLFK